MKTFRRTSWLILVGLCVAASSANAATFVVAVRDFFFRPTNLVINVSDSVLWTNQGSFPHDTTYGTATTPATNRLWASPQFSLGGTFSFTFSNAGVYPYICKTHVIDGIPPHPEQTGMVSVITGNLPPTVNITNPVNNARFTNFNSLNISASAADTNGAVDHVNFFVNGRLVGTDATSPYSAAADPASFVFGTNVLTAVVTDNLGLSTTSAPVNLIVTNFATTNIVRVQNFSFVPTNITVAAGSSIIWSNLDAFSHTATGDPTSLEPLCGPSVVLSATRLCTNRFMTPGVYPYSCSIHPFMVGTVVVVSASSTPMVGLTKPSSGAVFLTNSFIVFEATASDANGVASVQFFHSGNVNIGTVTSSPYSLSSTLDAGNYNVFAKATDTLGFGALTPPVPISVVAPAELQLLSPRVIDGSMQFDLTTTAGLSYVVERAEALPALFQTLSTNVATGAVLHVTDPTPVPGQTQRVYRAFIKP